MKVRIDEDECAGCGPCEDICPEMFEVVDGVAVAKADVVPTEHEEAVREAAENCPVEAIIIED